MLFLLGNASLNRSINIDIASNSFNLDIFAAASAASPGLAPSRNVTRGIVSVRIGSGVIIGSTASSIPAVRTGTGWGTGWTVEIIVEAGSARVQGAGGNGGYGATRFFSGVQHYYGGGGGGSGSNPGIGKVSLVNIGDVALPGADGTDSAGGSGASGQAGNSHLAGGNSQGSPGDAGGHAIEATAGGPSIYLRPAAGATLQVWGGGGGGGGTGYDETSFGFGSPGGSGGGPGQDGTAGDLGFSGGTHGKAYQQLGSSIIIESGPGTIDARGT